MKKVMLITLILFFVFSVNVYAVSNIRTYTISTEEDNISTEKLVNGTTKQYSKPSPVYDFFDENGMLNVVYTSEANVYWATFDENMNVTNTVKFAQYYDKSSAPESWHDLIYTFGNALYYNQHLYVVYGRWTSAEDASATFTETTMAMVKYDKTGTIVGKKEFIGALNNPTTDWGYGTAVPFVTNCNCSLTINDGVIACFFGKQMYNDHQSCSLLFVDAETMEWVSYPYEASENHPYEASEENKAKYKNVYTYYNSHSFGQRIVATTDGGYIMADHADASRRGILITKIYLDEENNFNSLRARMIHFREGAMGSHGYNYTYALMGNVIELSDGYMYIGAMEKTLDRAYGASVNESWNICIQKYKKDFQNYETIEEMQMFDTEVRTTTGTPPELPEGSTALDNPYGRLYLTGDEKDYGIKWLTDLKNEKMVIQLRAVELENDQIAILYELVNMAEDTRTGKYDLYDYDGDIYYMIIDGNGNIVSQPTIIPNVDLSPEEILPYKDGKIYWTTTLGEKTIEVNVLDVKNPLPTSKGDINKDGKVNISDARYGLAGIVKNTLTEEEIQLGDVDGNSKCNISDIRKILMLIVGKIDSLD